MSVTRLPAAATALVRLTSPVTCSVRSPARARSSPIEAIWLALPRAIPPLEMPPRPSAVTMPPCWLMPPVVWSQMFRAVTSSVSVRFVARRSRLPPALIRPSDRKLFPPLASVMSPAALKLAVPPIDSAADWVIEPVSEISVRSPGEVKAAASRLPLLRNSRLPLEVESVALSIWLAPASDRPAPAVPLKLLAMILAVEAWSMPAPAENVTLPAEIVPALWTIRLPSTRK